MSGDTSSGINQEAVAEYLDSQGGVELLIVISPAGTRYSELEEEMMVSDSTAYERIQDALELELIETESRQTEESGVVNLYVLTDFGQDIRKMIRIMKMDQLYWRMKTQQRLYDDLQKQLINWISGETPGYPEVKELGREIHEDFLE